MFALSLPSLNGSHWEKRKGIGSTFSSATDQGQSQVWNEKRSGVFYELPKEFQKPPPVLVRHTPSSLIITLRPVKPVAQKGKYT